MIRTSRGTISNCYIGNRPCGKYIGEKIFIYGIGLTSKSIEYFKANYYSHFNDIMKFCSQNKKYTTAINNDPDLICSLIDVGKERWLVGDGKAYIDTGIRFLTGHSFDIRFQILRNVDRYNFVVGSYNVSNRYSVRTRINTNDGVWIQFGSGSAAEGSTGYTPHNVKVQEGACYIDETEYKNSFKITDNGYDLYLFSSSGLHTAGVSSISESLIAYFSYSQGARKVSNFVPYLKNGEAGMLDIISGTFYSNANTIGQFTIQLTDKA